MKTGGTLAAVLEQVQTVERTKRDYVAPKNLLSMVILETERLGAKAQIPVMSFKVRGEETRFDILKRAHDQMAQELGIPAAYYHRMVAEAPELLGQNVNEWLHRDSESRRMIRTVGGDMRAYLSDRYRPLDNFQLAEAVLPVLMADGIQVESLALTEDRFYLKAVNSRITRDVKVGDAVQMGIVVSNSEVGAGALKVEPLIYRLTCLNGMIREDGKIRKYHVGRRTNGAVGEEDSGSRFFSDDTRRLDDKAFFAKVKDTVAGSFNALFFDQEVAKLRKAAGTQIEGKIEEVLEQISEVHSLNDTERSSVLDAYIKGGDMSQYGLANAVTRMAQDVDSYDRSQELERIGGRLIDSLLN